MPHRCSTFNCRGNYNGEPYTRMVKFPSDEAERKIWISAIPNETESLSKLKEVWICAKYFDCEWVTIKGGKRLNGPPTIFDVPKSCIKQTLSSPRATKTATAEARLLNQRMFEDKSDKINDFENVCTNIEIRYNAFRVYRKGNDLTLSMNGCYWKESSAIPAFQRT